MTTHNNIFTPKRIYILYPGLQTTLTSPMDKSADQSTRIFLLKGIPNLGLLVFSALHHAMRRQKSSRKPRPLSQATPAYSRRTRPSSPKSRRLRCDCGQVAVTVITRRVGCDPQYIVHLPLCRDCLALEKYMHAER